MLQRGGDDLLGLIQHIQVGVDGGLAGMAEQQLQPPQRITHQQPFTCAEVKCLAVSCPSAATVCRSSSPSMCTAKLCRRACGETETSSPSRAQRAFARRNTDCQVAGASGCPSVPSHSASGLLASPSAVSTSNRARVAGSSR